MVLLTRVCGKPRSEDSDVRNCPDQRLELIESEEVSSHGGRSAGETHRLKSNWKTRHERNIAAILCSPKWDFTALMLVRNNLNGDVAERLS
jgi:hypothetical protein